MGGINAEYMGIGSRTLRAETTTAPPKMQYLTLYILSRN